MTRVRALLLGIILLALSLPALWLIVSIIIKRPLE